VEFEKDVMREKRETLTGMLMALMDQKEARQAELNDRLTELEKNKSQETDNYWLIQYQKLLDSKPKVGSLKERLSTMVTRCIHGLGYCNLKG
jgi:E3 ubiquitin-protein ligase LRSAM1